MPTPHVLFAGGGSLNHVYPGLAVAEHLRRTVANVQVTFAGAGAARERHLVRAAGHHYTAIPTHPAPRNPLQAIRFVTDNLAGYCAARWMLREQRISLVVGLGGSTSVAVVRAAVDRGLPVVLFEQNAVPGRTTRWLSRAAVMVCAGFEEVRPHIHVQAPVTVTGNPTRMAFEETYFRLHGKHVDASGGMASAVRRSGHESPHRHAHADEGMPHNRRQRRLVILGGSAGARSLNEAVPTALAMIGSPLAAWQIVHQTGDGQLVETEARYAQLGVRALAVTHIDEAAPVLFASDLVVCRAAGTTLAELALAGVPAVVVPYPQATDNHQAANAKVFAAAGACRVIDEAKCLAGANRDGVANGAAGGEYGSLASALAAELEPLVTDDRLRADMAQAMHRQARPHATAEIASAIAAQLCGGLSSVLAA
jgi:UDP-N-acetylglucosamine--N-acetylmuramyl-(pentapeptide) pyrophosphoryl-undecaprenol N-acetylglucosamine transferase